MTPLRVFIGFDSQEPIAFSVLAHSILRRASVPVSITPVALNQLGGFWWRQRGPQESTEFSLTRFLVPYLAGFQGRALYLDCDMLCLADVAGLVDHVSGDAAVWVCPHDYTPRTTTKFLGQPQTTYPRKNWSSLMLFNTSVLRDRLTPERVMWAPASYLHRLEWADGGIGALPLEWNWLVGEYAPNPNAKILHYTLGGPWFHAYRNCDHAEEWFEELYSMLGASALTPSVGIGRG